MGLTPTFIDYIEQEPTIELLESIAKAPTDIFQIPENGSINQFYDNATRLGVFQASEFINPLPQNRTDQKFANALKKAAIDCLLSNFTLPNCNIPQNNSQNEQIYGNRSIYQLFKDPADPRPY
ncbi:putative signal peptide-containing protein [Cryptosporidium canis]|uniref:Signal peptide-containing protein n=1 Tax=Cryptosporidium canis TaxID=195482 RepID=A0A9D5HW37_9CRYT|nr:putative signal peptide-containing protein [Cryptosporidium canis]